MHNSQFISYIDYICGRGNRELCEAIVNGYNVLFEDAEGTAASRTRKYIRNNLFQYPLDKIAQDENGKPILTNSGKEQTVLDYLERQIRDVFFHNDYANIKFEPGVARIAFEDLDFQGRNQDSRGIEELKGILKILCSAHSNEYDYNLNGMSFEELHDRFSTESQQASEDDFNRIDSAAYTRNGDYRIVEIHSFDEAQSYYRYTNPDSRWCLTHMENMWDSYTGEGRNRVYFVLKDGFEDMKAVRGDGCPLDEYGLSMLCVIVTNDMNDDTRPMLCTSTCRWNHENGGSDSVMDVEQISNVIGQSFYRAFPPFSLDDLHSRGIYTFKEKLNEYNRSHDVEILDAVDDFGEGYAKVMLNRKYNFIDTDGNLLSNQWFDYVSGFYKGYADVKLNSKWNFIGTDGNLLSKQWFDGIGSFNGGYARVKLNGNRNLIGTDGNLLSKQWFDDISTFHKFYAIVELNGKYNFIDADGNLISNQWFDYAEVFRDGHAVVGLNGKRNFIDADGNLISNQWFDYAEDFRDGHAVVELNGKWNFIDTDGNLTPA